MLLKSFEQPVCSMRQNGWQKSSSLKMFLFQHQFTLITKEKHSVKELAQFVSLIYIRFWHDAPLATNAPLKDVQLLGALAC